MENKTYKELLRANERLGKELTEKEDECAKKGLKWEEMLVETKDIRALIAENDRKLRERKQEELKRLRVEGQGSLVCQSPWGRRVVHD